MSASPRRAESTPSRPRLLALVAAFAAVYLIWGSTYLAIRFAIETMPTFLMAGARFLTAGSVLMAVVLIRRAALPTAAQWRRAAVVGILLLLGGNGLVCWAQQSVDSGVAALVVSAMPLWMALLHWTAFKGPRPGGMLIAGIVVGFAGVATLTISESMAAVPDAIHAEAVRASSPWAIGALFAACFSWATGSLISRKRSEQGGNVFASSAMQMIVGGIAMLAVGTVRGEWTGLDFATMSAKSMLSWGYLVVFGSLVAFSAYVWLLSVASPAAVSTYAYVNPIVAVLLGWWLAGERLSPLTLVAGVLIIGAVVLMTVRQEPQQASTSMAGADDEGAVATGHGGSSPGEESVIHPPQPVAAVPSIPGLRK
jgi:drug/metabolite transporter (DMT)-like permease